MFNKRELISLILSTLHQELEAISQSAKAAHEAATHEESKAEDSHDTRGLEASYLAGAQMARIESLKKTMIAYQTTDLREWKTTDPIGIGALIELDLDGKRLYCFLVSQGGGISVQLEGKNVQTITPQAPLSQALLGRRVGELVEVEIHQTSKEYEVISII